MIFMNLLYSTITPDSTYLVISDSIQNLTRQLKYLQHPKGILDPLYRTSTLHQDDKLFVIPDSIRNLSWYPKSIALMGILNQVQDDI
jgi:hypothetical protein